MSENRDPTSNIVLGPQKDEVGTDSAAKAAKAAAAAASLVSKGAGAVVMNMGASYSDDEPLEKDYKLEPDEVNELFRATSSQRGGLGLQLCIFFTVVLFILVDTVSISSV